MTLTTVAQANSKTAEFARLFDLFDRVATRRTRALAGDTSDVISADDIANVPIEFAPVLKNLSTILSSRAQRAQDPSTTTPRPTAATISELFMASNNTQRADVIKPTDGAEEDTECAAFPLGQRYPFTFKLMLHKLYDLNEWAEKVKEAVEISRSQFKPLAERAQNVIRDATASTKEQGEKKSSVRPVLGASVKFKPSTTARCLHSAATSRDAATNKEREGKQNSPRPTLGASAKFKPPSTTRRPVVAFSKPEVTRVLKKRCIGRRKSVNDPVAPGVWVYDAAISAMEVSGSRPSIEITLLRRWDTNSGVENYARHRSLTDLEGMQPDYTSRHKVKVTVPFLQEEVTKSAPLRPSATIQGIVDTESGIKRKRSIASAFVSEFCTRAMGPLCA